MAETRSPDPQQAPQPRQQVQPSQGESRLHADADRQAFQRVFSGVRVEWNVLAPRLREECHEASSEPLLLVGPHVDGQTVAFASALKTCMERVAPTSERSR